MIQNSNIGQIFYTKQISLIGNINHAFSSKWEPNNSTIYNNHRILYVFHPWKGHDMRKINYK